MRSPSPALAVALILAACSSGLPPDPVLPHDTFTMRSESLDEQRRINVYLPPGYLDSTATFPVLYMPDGGVGEDFPHIAGTVAELVATGAIAPLLVVGIENTARRRDLTGPTAVASDREVAPVVGGSAAFRAFVADELIPEIERRYRCSGQRAIVGESLAGLFVVETLFEAPELFERCIAISPSLWWNDHALVRRARERIAALGGTPRVLWLTAADETDIFPFTDALAAELAAHAPATLRWTYAPMREQHHDTIFRAAKAAAFRAALWRPAADGR